MSVPSQLIGSLAAGSQLHEYKIERVLGHGGFGITYLATDTHLDKPVAIKEYLPADMAVRMADSTISVRAPDSEEAFRWGLQSFVKEAKILARFSHPALIQVHRFFEANGTAYFVMDYAEGTTLSSLLKVEGTLAEDRLRRIIFPVLNGLEEVHKAGVLHRDIKPENIILRRDGAMPVLIDFGAAKQNVSSATRSVMSVLTAGYAPLEQYATTGTQGPWTDLYALGAVCYRALSGKKPVDSVNRVRDDPMLPAAMVGLGKYSPEFLAAVDWALAVNAEDRPQDIDQWRKALDGQLKPPEPRQPSGRWAKAGSVSQLATDAGPTELVDSRRATAINPSPTEATEIQRKLPEMPAPAAAGAPKWMPMAAIGGAVLVVVAGLAFWLTRGKPTPPPETAKAPVVSPAPVPAPAPAPVQQAPAPQPQATPPAEQKAPAPGAAPVPPPVAAKAPAPKPAPSREAPKVAAKPAPAPAEQAAPKQGAIAGMTPLSAFQDCPRCPEMVALAAGSFPMGAGPKETAAKWEKPQHVVKFAKPFAIARFEVTGNQWQACVAGRACSAAVHASQADLPAVNLAWADAQAYAAWLSQTTGRHYRLPGEAEWEYAIRGGTTTSRFWGDDRRGQCEHANGADLSGLKKDKTLPAGDKPCDDGFAGLAPVGRLKPNAFGLFDLAGNAWEWTQDCWKDSYAGAPSDGRAFESAACKQRVIRGGSFRTKPESLRSANRGLSPPEQRSEDLGFRVVAD